MGVSIHGHADHPSRDTYRLPELWCLHFYRYEAEIDIAGQTFPLRPGYVSVIPPDTLMVYRYRGLSEHCYCHFRLKESDGTTSVPVAQDLGRRFTELEARMREVATGVGLPAGRRQAAVWEILWELAYPESSAASSTQPGHPTVDRALQILEERLGDTLSVADLAEELGISYSYLSKLFGRYQGDTVVGYIRRRRAERAEHLLRSSTLPIKSIAASVGVPDLQQFNRMIRASTGNSPRGIRSGNLPK
jgi:AraC-like DNA-binding protein